MADGAIDKSKAAEGKLSATVTRNADPAHADASASGTEITIATVRRWIEQEAPRWPHLDDEYLVRVACTCEHERQQQPIRLAKEREYGQRIANIRGAIQRARTGIDMVLTELPAIEAEIRRIEGEWHAATNGGSTAAALGSSGQEYVQICENASHTLIPLKEILRATRIPGGHPIQRSEFLEDVSDLLGMALEFAGANASVKEGGPLSRVVAQAVEASRGENISPSAVAAALQRGERRRSNAMPGKVTRQKSRNPQ